MPVPVGLAVKGFTPFDASRYPTPLHACWASDPAWANPGDGNAVSSMRNQSGGGDPAQATSSKRPIYRASVAVLNNRPAVQFDGTDDFLNIDVANTAQPFKLLCVGALSASAGVVRSALGFDVGSERIGASAGNVWVLNSGSALASATAINTAGHIFDATVNGASSSLTLDGTVIASGNAGSSVLNLFTLGAAGTGTSSFWIGHLAFAAAFAAAADLSSLRSALAAFYGITVA